MKRTWWILGVTLPLAVGAMLGCNGLLGIGPASLDSDDGGAPGTAKRGLTCEYYCQTIVQNCTQANAEFLGSEDPTQLCMSMCPVFDTGSAIGATNDNTLGCRINYAEQSASDPVTNCRFAGVMGGGKCGNSACSLFCSLDVSYCNGTTVNTPAYPDQNGCLSACQGGGDAGAGFPYLTQDAGDLLEGTNTLNCRFWHLENANGSTANGNFHCPHTEPVSMTCQ